MKHGKVKAGTRTNLLEGLTVRQVASTDKSTKMPKGSKETARKHVASAPKAPGPRSIG